MIQCSRLSWLGAELIIAKVFLLDNFFSEGEDPTYLNLNPGILSITGRSEQLSICTIFS